MHTHKNEYVVFSIKGLYIIYETTLILDREYLEKETIEIRNYAAFPTYKISLRILRTACDMR